MLLPDRLKAALVQRGILLANVARATVTPRLYGRGADIEIVQHSGKTDTFHLSEAEGRI